MSITHEQKRAAFEVILAVAECLRALGSVPSGVFYARLMGMPGMSGTTAAQFGQLVGTLKGAGLVEEQDHLLTWVGPKVR